MAVTAASLKVNRPEFANADNTVVTNFIAKAERRHCSDVWGDAYDDGVELLTCDMLARSPFARDLRLVKESGRTVYFDEWTAMARQFGGAYRLYP